MLCRPKTQGSRKAFRIGGGTPGSFSGERVTWPLIPAFQGLRRLLRSGLPSLQTPLDVQPQGGQHAAAASVEDLRSIRVESPALTACPKGLLKGGFRKGFWPLKLPFQGAVFDGARCQYPYGKLHRPLYLPGTGQTRSVSSPAIQDIPRGNMRPKKVSRPGKLRSSTAIRTATLTAQVSSGNPHKRERQGSL